MTELLQFTLFGLMLGCVYAIAAMGLVLTYTVTGVFNFAHGAVGMLAAFTYFELRVAPRRPDADRRRPRRVRPRAARRPGRRAAAAPVPGRRLRHVARRHRRPHRRPARPRAAAVRPGRGPQRARTCSATAASSCSSVPITYDRIAQVVVAAGGGLRAAVPAVRHAARAPGCGRSSTTASWPGLNGVRSTRRRPAQLDDRLRAGRPRRRALRRRPEPQRHRPHPAGAQRLRRGHGRPAHQPADDLRRRAAARPDPGAHQRLVALARRRRRSSGVRLAIPGIFLVVAVLLVPSFRLSAGRVVGRDEPRGARRCGRSVVAGAVLVAGVAVLVQRRRRRPARATSSGPSSSPPSPCRSSPSPGCRARCRSPSTCSSASAPSSPARSFGGDSVARHAPRRRWSPPSLGGARRPARPCGCAACTSRSAPSASRSSAARWCSATRGSSGSAGLSVGRPEVARHLHDVRRRLRRLVRGRVRRARRASSASCGGAGSAASSPRIRDSELAAATLGLPVRVDQGRDLRGVRLHRRVRRRALRRAVRRRAGHPVRAGQQPGDPAVRLRRRHHHRRRRRCSPARSSPCSSTPSRPSPTSPASCSSPSAPPPSASAASPTAWPASCSTGVAAAPRALRWPIAGRATPTRPSRRVPVAPAARSRAPHEARAACSAAPRSCSPCRRRRRAPRPRRRRAPRRRRRRARRLSRARAASSRPPRLLPPEGAAAHRDARSTSARPTRSPRSPAARPPSPGRRPPIPATSSPTPTTLLTHASPDYPAGTVPHYPYRVSATSGFGAPTAESEPAPGSARRGRGRRRQGSTARGHDAPRRRARRRHGRLDERRPRPPPPTAPRSPCTPDGDERLRPARHRHDRLDRHRPHRHVRRRRRPSSPAAPRSSGASVLGTPVTIDAEGIHGSPEGAPDDPTRAGSSVDRQRDRPARRAARGHRRPQRGPRRGRHPDHGRRPAEQEAGTAGQRSSAGLRIDFELSSDTVPDPRHARRRRCRPSTAAPGAPGVEDLLAFARARHLTRLELGRGTVVARRHARRSAYEPPPFAAGRRRPPTGSRPSATCRPRPRRRPRRGAGPSSRADRDDARRRRCPTCPSAPGIGALAAARAARPTLPRRPPRPLLHRRARRRRRRQLSPGGTTMTDHRADAASTGGLPPTSARPASPRAPTSSPRAGARCSPTRSSSSRVGGA